MLLETHTSVQQSHMLLGQQSSALKHLTAGQEESLDVAFEHLSLAENIRSLVRSLQREDISNDLCVWSMRLILW